MILFDFVMSMLLELKVIPDEIFHSFEMNL